MSGLPAALLGFTAGTLALQWQPVLAPPWPSLTTAVVAALGAWLAYRAAGRALRWRTGLVMLLAALAGTSLGFGIATLRAELRLADRLPVEWQDVDVTLIGVIDDLPHASPRGTRLTLAVERPVTPDAIVPTRLSLAWYPSRRDLVASDVPALRAGERWELTVRLRPPHGSVNPHGFDLEAWLLQNGLRATGYVRPDGVNRRITAFAGRPGDWVQRAREAVRERALGALRDAPYAGVIVALAIGDQRAIPEAQWSVFNRTGVTHLISISGLHVTVFAALAAMCVNGFVRRLPRVTSVIPARRVAALAGALAAFGYVLLAGAQIPAQRTLVMLVVAAVGLWLGRPGTARIVWLWALAIVLAFDPWAGLTPGFWLSFGAVGLLLYSGTARLHSTARSRPDAVVRAVRTAAHAQFVVTVGLVPMTLAVFQQVSLAAPVANALAIPMVTFAVVPLALAAVVMPFDFPWQAAHAVFSVLMLLLEWLAHLPVSTWQQHAPAPWTVLAAMLGVVWLLAPPGVPLRILGLVWLLPLDLVRPPPPAPGTFELTVLDVGQGLAAVVRTHSRTLLYDTGPRFNDEADAGGRIIAPYLRAEGVGRLAMLVVSHLDADHSGGARSLLQTVPAEELLSSVPFDDPLWAGRGGDVVRCWAGQRWAWDGVVFTIVHPQPQGYGEPRTKTNDLSCVLRVEAAAGSALITGDIEARSEMVLLGSTRALATDVLVVPHHGSRTSSTAAFIAATAPQIAVFAAGYRNRFGHPRRDVVERYRAVGALLPRTDLQGAIRIVFDGAGALRVVSERDRQRRYWYDVPRDDEAR